MAAVEVEIDAVEMNELMFYSSLKTGDAPGNMASIVKMRGTEVGEKVTELAVEAVGWYGAPFTELRNYDSNIVPVGGDYVDDVSPRYFNNRKTTIYGGSSEVQRNVLAKTMLGLWRRLQLPAKCLSRLSRWKCIHSTIAANGNAETPGSSRLCGR